MKTKLSRFALLCVAIAILIPPTLYPTSTYGGPLRNRLRARQARTYCSPAPAASKTVYPQARRSDQVDNYHGTLVADPYRWLEDPDSPETKAWVQAENKLTQRILGSIPERQAIKNRLKLIWDYEKYSMPTRRGTRIFYNKNSGLQNQYVLYVEDSPGAQARVLLDPNTLSPDGTIAVSGTSLSEDGNLLAYGLSYSGSDWTEWKVRDVNTGKDLDDHLKWIKFSSAAWSKDNKGFYYSRYDEPNEKTKLQDANYYQELYYHRLGTAQSEDVLIYERPDQKEWGFAGSVTDDGRYLLIYVWQGTEHKNQVFYKDLALDNAPVVELLNKADASYNLIDNDGPIFWFHTDLNAPKQRVIAIDVHKSTADHLEILEVIPEANEALEAVSLVGNRFFASYLKDACSQIKEYDLQGRLVRLVHLPDAIGSASGFSGKRSDNNTYYHFTSYLEPGTIYKYDIDTGESKVHFRPKVRFDTSKFVTEQVFYTSKDGTRVPMFLTYRKGLKRDGSNATYLYGYGGFGASASPSFSINMLVWMEMGGVFAEACIRGGSEYGEEWHQAGTKLRKQNAFDDFIAAGEWLIANKYTSKAKLAIGGGSNGGLLVGACLTQRPDLYGAACPDVGVMDMLRFHKFTIGWAWTSDYGSSDDPNQFKALYAYSPLHNIKPGTNYPPTLIATADHDDRVVPAHSFKFTAALQAAQAGNAPCIVRIETEVGHGAGEPTEKQIEYCADKWAFLVKALHIPACNVKRLNQ